jgi:signal peptidase I
MSQAQTAASKRRSQPTAILETLNLIEPVARTLLIQPCLIQSGCEEPNLHRRGYILFSKWSYGYSRHSIPGYRIEVSRGRLVVNGHEVARQSARTKNATENRGQCADPGAIPTTLVRETDLEGRRYLTQVLTSGGKADNTGVDEWHNDGAVLLRPWTWLTQLRPWRILTVLK